MKRCQKSIRLDGRELRATFVRAVQQGKEARWVIYFADEDITAELVLTPGQTTSPTKGEEG